ncbi:MAG TPA: endopeptidase La [Candidatus Babeliales bacterium]|nr:endopeptidase La [Candidatus Babeliales bacterium]
MSDPLSSTYVSSRTVLDEPHILPLLPLKNVVILPKSIIPIIVGRDVSIRAVEAALSGNRLVFLTAQKEEAIENPSINDLYTYGTVATILQDPVRMPNGALKILAESMYRAKLESLSLDNNYFNAVYTELPSINCTESVELQALWRQLCKIYIAYTKFDERASTHLIENIQTATDIDNATDTIAVHSNLPFDERQIILETVDLHERILLLCKYIQREVDILQTEQRIRSHIQTQVEKSQREYYLNEQMKAIQKELGREDHNSDIEDLRVQAIKLNLSQEAMKRVEKELKRLEQMPPMSSEAGVSRHYIEWILALPWQTSTQDTISIKQAERILSKNHAGLGKIKERIIEFLAAKKFSKNLERGPIICLAGPPGVGKTSLARAIAESMGREFVRISLGGVRDEAEIRGHRRTYIGALPGKILQAMRKAGTKNPVILLDEIDKMSRDVHGDPASALLEVLDPEQNKTFVDHFLDTDYDLSNVMFIATANVIENIPYPLFDRLEILSLSGYTEEEKKLIAQQFLIPRGLKEHSLTKTQFKLNDDLLIRIIDEYTKEAGVRQLERVLTKLMRKTIQLLLDENNPCKNVKITEELLFEWLGHPLFKKTSLTKATKHIGLATGLAWTEVGGDILEIETSVLPGKGNVTLTGQLGEVMQESAQAALSYIRSRAKELGIKPTFHTSKDIHIHIPEGATPKDGPSAGITICISLISALTQKPTRADVAMTGEITLRGRVLCIGGLKEKLLAARQYNFNMVLIPHENENDLKDVRKEVDLGNLIIIPVKTMDDVIQQVFFENPLIAIKEEKKKMRTAKQKTSIKNLA